MQIPFTTWAETRARFTWELPAYFNYGRDVIDAFAAATPDKLCLIAGNDAGGERRFTWGEVSRLTSRLANALAAAGIKPGDRVVIMLPRIPEWQIASIACTKVGAVIVPCIEMLTQKDVDYRIRHSGAVAATGIACSVSTMRSCTRSRSRFRAASYARTSACSNANASAEPWLLNTRPRKPSSAAPL